MRKFNFAIIFLFIITNPLIAQGESASVITDSTYLKSPRLYLSKLDTNKIQSIILIDRVIYDSLMLNCNGDSRVTTINSTNWKNIYSNLKWAHIDTTANSDIDTISKVANLMYKSSLVYPIGIIDCFFKRIKQSAISNGEFLQQNEFLYDYSASSNSFSNERIVAVSCLQPNIVGDDVRFIVDDFFNISNNLNQTLETIEIDFDNGIGFEKVNRNEIIEVLYTSESRYHELKFKLILIDNTTQTRDTLYSNCSVFRTGTSTVPTPSAVIPELRSISPHSTRPNLVYYPSNGLENITTTCVTKFTKIMCKTQGTPSANTKLEAYFLMNPNNKSGILRRPFIVCDGFDPGDARDYYSTIKEVSKTNKDNDFRGLLQLINGDNSPWYPNDEFPNNVNLVDALKSDGYDIVVVNFLDGAGDIIQNGNAFKGFLNEIINSKLRDNKTEEAVIVGPSMGGLITRYAIKTLENEGENAFVKTWISFDSPHKGAYIPIGLQHTVSAMSKIEDPIINGNDGLRKAKEKFQNSVDKINTVAAKEMLLYHFSKTNSKSVNPADHTSLFDDLYSELDVLGYPQYSKNYAITNGGKSKLYNNTAQIVDFKIFDWTWARAYGNQNFPGNYQILRAETLFYSYDMLTNSQIAYENAPGGWHSALYSLNCDPGNKHQKTEYSTQYTKACFIPTVSALGQVPTQSNIHNTWEVYTGKMQNDPGKIITPFDVILGMHGANEEHVRISGPTRDSLMYNLRRDFNNSVKPVVRNGDVLNQTITGMVAYVVKNNLTFAGSNNLFTIELNTDTLKQKADVNAVAGNSIQFLPGFSVKKGASLSAIIDQTINYSSTLRKAAIDNGRKAVDYSKPSPYLGKVVSCIQTQDSEIEENSGLVNIIVSPNPILNNALIKYSGIEADNIEIQIFDISGRKIKTEIHNNTGSATVNMTSFEKGFYLVKVIYGEKSKTIKVLKQ